MNTTFPTSPPMAVPRPMTRFGRAVIFLIVALVALAMISAALFSVGTSSPVGDVRNGLIAYDSNGDIWLADPEKGYETRQLTTTAATETSPVWSPDGTRIAYWSRRGDTSSIAIMDAEGAVLRELTQPAGFTLPAGGEPSWSPDGRSVVVVAGSDFSATVVIDVDTGMAHALPVFAGKPSWASDGSLIAWGAEGAQEPGLHIARSDGSDERVASAGRTAGSPNFTPAVDRIVFDERSETGTDGDIVSIALDGSDHRTIVGGVTNDRAPRLSPDGLLAAFLRSDATNLEDCCGSSYADLYVADVEGTTEPRVLETRVGDWGVLEWSPDGTRLALFNFASDQILVVALDPTVEPVKIPSPGNVGILSWQTVR